MNKFNVGGREYSIPDGANISIINNVVYVNGQQWSDRIGIKEVVLKIEVEGNVSIDTCDSSLTVNGDVVAHILKVSGNLNCRDVSGDIGVGGNVNCKNVTGSVRANGNVNCSSKGS